MAGKPSRIVLHVSIAVLLLPMIEAAPVSQRASAIDGKTTKSGNRLIVHEWGTFTSIAGKNGGAVDWRPLNGSSDLPGFVYDTSGLDAGTGLRSGQRCIKCDMEALVRMEKGIESSLSDSSHDLNEVAEEITRKHGRFAEPVLKAVLEKTSDPQLRTRIQKIINYAGSNPR